MLNKTQTTESSKKFNKLPVVFSIASFLLAVATLFLRNQYSLDRAIINIGVIGLAILILWSKSWQLGKKQIGLIIILLSLIGLLVSLLFKDDYSGGEWLIHFHRGYPYGWRDGGMSIWPAIDKGIVVSEYIAQNPKLIHWTVDFPALVVDSFFWINASIIIILLSDTVFRVVRTRLGWR